MTSLYQIIILICFQMLSISLESSLCLMSHLSCPMWKDLNNSEWSRPFRMQLPREKFQIRIEKQYFLTLSELAPFDVFIMQFIFHLLIQLYILKGIDLKFIQLEHFLFFSFYHIHVQLLYCLICSMLQPH